MTRLYLKDIENYMKIQSDLYTLSVQIIRKFLPVDDFIFQPSVDGFIF